jgi:predicted DCC family thiol-disulfide oxidoreductase YuxK
MERAMVRRGFKFATLQSRRERPQVFDEMILELPDGRELGGADAAMEIARRIWWLWPLWLVSRIPGAMMVFRASYRWIAPHRYCLGGRCELKNSATNHHRHAVFFEMP